MEELTTIIISGAVWDAIKMTIRPTVNYLKTKLSNWFISDDQLEEIAECVNNIPDAYCVSEGMIKEYLNLNEKILDILKEINNKAPKISQKIKGNNNNVVGTGTINVYRNPEIDEKNLEINRKNLEVNEKSLKILEADHNPYFSLECKGVWSKLEETKGTNKIAKTQYALVNSGGKIKNVILTVQSYILFYVPTEIEDEWYIFKYPTNNFGVNKYSRRIREEEAGRRFVFYEYVSEKQENENSFFGLDLGRYLYNNLNKGITHSYRNILDIIYTDYMGEEKRKKYSFLGSELNELEKELEGAFIGVNLDATISTRDKKVISTPIDINDVESVGRALKEEIENWLRENRAAKGYKNVVRTFYNYDIVD